VNDPIALRIQIEDLMVEYTHLLDDGDLNEWPMLFVEDCFYQVIPRENHDQSLPLATIRCESRGMLEDRVMAVQETSMFEPRYLRHITSGLRYREADGLISAQSSYAVFETVQDEYTRVFNVGRYLDEIVRDEGRLRFRRRICVFDSELVPNSIVYPI
jgi:3-phenylpropionate/cinnamic acid dioxygenase small subunit